MPGRVFTGYLVLLDSAPRPKRYLGGRTIGDSML